MRSNLELWGIGRDNFDEYVIKYDFYGLCITIVDLYGDNLISLEEKMLLQEEIIYYKKDSDGGYFLGKKGDQKPRKEFIEKMIKKHKNIL